MLSGAPQTGPGNFRGRAIAASEKATRSAAAPHHAAERQCGSPFFAH
jgi:hypothetical protein